MNWLWNLAIKKVVKRVVQLVVAWATAAELQKYGIELNVEGLTLGVYALFEFIRNFLKVKLNIKWL